MKKLLLSALLVATAMGASAQRWDFTKWSDETVANLKAVNAANNEWSDIEKVTDTAPTDISKENCFWQVVASGADGITLSANGVNIKETEGLIFTNTSARSLAIAVNYPETSLGTYQGPSYLWLGSKNQNYIVIPGVKPGTEIKIGLESHKPAEARGVQLFIGRGNSGTQLNAPDGSAVDVPTTYEDQVWLVPEDATDTPNEDGTYDITIRNTNGCHLYYIDCGTELEADPEIAFLYDSSKAGYDVNADPIHELLLGKGNVTLVDIKDFTADTDTVDGLEAKDLVVLSETPSSGHAFHKALAGMVGRVPMLNTKSYFYKNWGWGAGSNPNPGTATIALTEAGAAHEMWAEFGYEAGEEIEIYEGWPEDYITPEKNNNLVQGYTVTDGSLIAEDDVLATVSGINAMHVHGTSNAYMLFPYSSDAIVAGVTITDDGMDLLDMAIDYLIASKSAVRQALPPTIQQDYYNGETVVKITTGVAGAVIYYTTDGTEPTTASAKWVMGDSITVTEATTVKAYISAVGYNDSEVATAEVVVKSQWAAPELTITRNENNTVVELTTTEEGGQIYFNFAGGETVITSQLYTEAITLTEPGTLYAFVAGGDKLNSEIAGQYIGINGITEETIRLDTLSYFDSNPTDWFVTVDEVNGTGDAKAYYYWGKDAWNYYSTEVDHTEPALDENGNQLKNQAGEDSVIVYYKPDPNAVKSVVPANANGWVIKSAGQVLTLEGNLDANANVGNGEKGRYAETAMDAISGKPTNGCITFGGKVSGDPYTGTIETTEAHAGPFDVVAYVGNGNSGSKPVMEIQISADGAVWTKLGDVNLADTQRYWKKTVLSYNETAPVYVRLAQTGGGSKAQVYEISLMVNGEVSKGYVDGVELPAATAAEVVSVQIYNLSGAQLSEMGEGLNIVRIIYSDGTVEVKKVLNK